MAKFALTLLAASSSRHVAASHHVQARSRRAEGTGQSQCPTVPLCHAATQTQYTLMVRKTVPGKPVTRIPIMAKQVLDLYELYRLVVQHGGLVEIINKKLWREITKGLNLPSSITSAAFTLRTQ